MLLVHDESFENWVFDAGHPTQGRRFTHGRDTIKRLAEFHGVEYTELGLHPINQELFREVYLHEVHTPKYVSEVVDHYQSNEWDGQRPDLAQIAQNFVQASIIAFNALWDGQALTAINLTGAKHHAKAEHSSGFCVFNDFAILASIANKSGKKVAIFDLDAHHGDGTEELTKHLPNVLTYSTHQHGIFPWTGTENNSAKNVYNRPLMAGDGDGELLKSAIDFVKVAKMFEPDFIFIAGGADGHVSDPLSDLEFTFYGYELAGQAIRKAFPDTPILLGGAGGYRPDDATPASWASLAIGLDKT